MKTLILTLEYPPDVGGIASYIYNFAAHLSVDSFIIVAPPAEGAKEFDAVQPWKTYRRAPYWLFFWPHWFRLLLSVWRLVRQEQSENLSIHQVFPLGHIGYILKKLKIINSYTIFLHGTDLELATQKKSKRHKFIKICTAADRIVVNSHFLEEKLRTRVEGLPPVQVVYPCPAEHFLKSVLPTTITTLKTQLALQGKKVIITVGRMVEGKGYPHLARVLPAVLAEVPNLVWLIIGTGPKEQEVIAQIQKNYLQNVVRFLGKVAFDDLPKYFQAADLFVLLTHPDEGREEGFGTVFLEAAASGLPVVAGRAGGVEEAVEDRVTGLVVDINQDKAIAAAIIALLKNSDYGRQMGQAGKERVAREFVWEKQIAKLTINN